MRILCSLSFIFMLCAGCQTTSQDWPPAAAYTTVKRTLLEVTNAILISYRQDLGRETSKVTMTTNAIPGVSFTLAENEIEGKGLGAPWTTTTISATIVNSLKQESRCSVPPLVVVASHLSLLRATVVSKGTHLPRLLKH